MRGDRVNAFIYWNSIRKNKARWSRRGGAQMTSAPCRHASSSWGRGWCSRDEKRREEAGGQTSGLHGLPRNIIVYTSILENAWGIFFFDR